MYAEIYVCESLISHIPLCAALSWFRGIADSIVFTFDTTVASPVSSRSLFSSVKFVLVGQIWLLDCRRLTPAYTSFMNADRLLLSRVHHVRAHIRLMKRRSNIFATPSSALIWNFREGEHKVSTPNRAGTSNWRWYIMQCNLFRRIILGSNYLKFRSGESLKGRCKERRYFLNEQAFLVTLPSTQPSASSNLFKKRPHYPFLEFPSERVTRLPHLIPRGGGSVVQGLHDRRCQVQISRDR